MLTCRSRSAAWAFRLSVLLVAVIAAFVALITYGNSLYNCNPNFTSSQDCYFVVRWIAWAAPIVSKLFLVYGYGLLVPAAAVPLSLLYGAIVEIRARQKKRAEPEPRP